MKFERVKGKLITEWRLEKAYCEIYLVDFLLSGDTLTEEEVMMLINAADRDGDGTLDFEEFVKIMMG